jgi:hypothetical protein
MAGPLQPLVRLQLAVVIAADPDQVTGGYAAHEERGVI